MANTGYAGDIAPAAAWDILSTDPKAVLVDVRTTAEWAYVGVPDVSSLGKEPMFVCWATFPHMQINPKFAEQIRSANVPSDAPLLFLCRSGVRSRSAAIAMTAAGYATCYNIASGFEGDHDEMRRRGAVNGWKVEGLPWVQA